MPATGNALVASFGLDLNPLKRDFAQAAQIAQTGSAQVASALRQSMQQASQASPMNWGGLAQQRYSAFLATTPRPRTAADFMPAPAGKYPSPASQEEGGGGFGGLPGGLRTIGLFTALYRLESAYGTAVEKAKKLRAENDAIFSPIGGGTAAEDFWKWARQYQQTRFSVEWEANEFGGRLLVPIDSLRSDFDKFVSGAQGMFPQWWTNVDLRAALTHQLAPTYGANPSVIGLRLDREELWPNPE